VPHQAVAKELTLNLNQPLAAQDFYQIIAGLLQELGQRLNIRGIIPGHLKVLVVENDVFAAYSCTMPGKITDRVSPGWHDFLFFHPRLYLNVVLVEIPLEKVHEIVNSCLEEMLRKLDSYLIGYD